MLILPLLLQPQPKMLLPNQVLIGQESAEIVLEKDKPISHYDCGHNANYIRGARLCLHRLARRTPFVTQRQTPLRSIFIANHATKQPIMESSDNLITTIQQLQQMGFNSAHVVCSNKGEFFCPSPLLEQIYGPTVTQRDVVKNAAQWLQTQDPALDFSLYGWVEWTIRFPIGFAEGIDHSAHHFVDFETSHEEHAIIQQAIDRARDTYHLAEFGQIGTLMPYLPMADPTWASQWLLPARDSLAGQATLAEFIRFDPKHKLYYVEFNIMDPHVRASLIESWIQMAQGIGGGLSLDDNALSHLEHDQNDYPQCFVSQGEGTGCETDSGLLPLQLATQLLIAELKFRTGQEDIDLRLSPYSLRNNSEFTTFPNLDAQAYWPDPEVVTENVIIPLQNLHRDSLNPAVAYYWPHLISNPELMMQYLQQVASGHSTVIFHASDLDELAEHFGQVPSQIPLKPTETASP